MIHLNFLYVFILFNFISGAFVITNDNNSTVIRTKNVTFGEITVKLEKTPHHLFVGRCKANDTVIHQENIILKNDGRSQVAANIVTRVDGPIHIACVKIYDEVPDGEGGYPSYVAGGVGQNFIEFNVMTSYGKGFHFFIQIYGQHTGTTIRTSTLQPTVKYFPTRPVRKLGVPLQQQRRDESRKNSIPE